MRAQYKNVHKNRRFTMKKLILALMATVCIAAMVAKPPLKVNTPTVSVDSSVTGNRHTSNGNTLQ